MLDSDSQPALEPRIRAIEREKEWAACPLFLLGPIVQKSGRKPTEMENDHEISRPKTRPKPADKTAPKRVAPAAAKRPAKPRAERAVDGGEIDLRSELQAELDGIAEQAECELVHAEWRGGTLQVLIDREGGVTLTDCERISKEISAFLDILDFGNTRYVLEVSSPGLDRQLYRPRDYQRFVGSKVRITYSSPEVRKRTLIARLEAFHAEPESVTLLDEESGERLTLRLDQIQVARLEIEL